MTVDADVVTVGINHNYEHTLNNVGNKCQHVLYSMFLNGYLSVIIVVFFGFYLQLKKI